MEDIKKAIIEIERIVKKMTRNNETVESDLRNIKGLLFIIQQLQQGVINPVIESSHSSDQKKESASYIISFLQTENENLRIENKQLKLLIERLTAAPKPLQNKKEPLNRCTCCNHFWCREETESPTRLSNQDFEMS